MDISFAKGFLLWALLINYGVIIVWFMAFRFGHAWLFRLHSRWFHLSEERFDAIHYSGMAAYKIGIILLALAPYIALSIMGARYTG